jgi:hypothetical protein
MTLQESGTWTHAQSILILKLLLLNIEEFCPPAYDVFLQTFVDVSEEALFALAPYLFVVFFFIITRFSAGIRTIHLYKTLLYTLLCLLSALCWFLAWLTLQP